jgi:hypothetical protein
MTANTQFSLPESSLEGEWNELYRLYVSALQRARDRVLQTTTAGEYQTWLLNRNRILPKEVFEAKLATIAHDRPRYEALVQALHEAA